jgi:glutamate-5-semialdehyde dehydrogenase
MATTAAIPLSIRKALHQAREAAGRLAEFSTEQKNAMLLQMADAIEVNSTALLDANRADLASCNLEGAMRDRLLLTPERISAMARGIRDVASLPDPVYEKLAEWTRPNGLRICRIRVPLGVLGIIYESRPNVTADTVALALKTSNAVVLRGGKEAARSNQCIAEVLGGLAGMPQGSITLLDSSSRESAAQLINARGLVDVIIPRGGPELISWVTENSTVPVIETGAGNCHIFVDQFADFGMADDIVINAKTQRPSVCNAAEKLLVHEQIAPEYIPRIVAKLIAAGVEVRGDDRSRDLAQGLAVRPAETQDWGEEYLRLCMAVRVVSGIEEAIQHINLYSTKHSESIVTASESNARRFLRQVDSSCVYWNASTRFSDGGEFGFGAEMGISTQKLHCRGPFALVELTSTKYQICGNGQIRK